MNTSFTLLCLPGDGIGPEVMAATRQIINWFSANSDLTFECADGLIGGAAYDEYGNPYPEETQKLAYKADALLLGAVGGPKWADVDFAKRPEQGLLDLRSDLNLFANLRPAHVFAPLAESSSLKPDIVKGLDVLIVRELIGGIYFGQPRGLEKTDDGLMGFNTTRYSEKEVKRIAAIAFEAAAKRGKKVHSIDKANVLESMIVWRETVTTLAPAFKDVQLEHMYVDNAAMQLATNPAQFDVMVCPNLIGDVLSDLAAALTGSLGLLPSASLGGADEDGHRAAVYEPVHGSAPDIAGQNKANPLAMILSFAMCLEHSCGRPQLAQQLTSAVEQVLAEGIRTADIANGHKGVSTEGMAGAVIKQLDKNLLQKAS